MTIACSTGKRGFIVALVLLAALASVQWWLLGLAPIKTMLPSSAAQQAQLQSRQALPRQAVHNPVAQNTSQTLAEIAALDVCIVAPTTPFDPSLGLALTAARSIPGQARCPVCGMFPARFPQWASQVIFENGDAQFFDSAANMFIFLNQLARYAPNRHADEIVARFSADFTTGQWLAVEHAFYVHGSSVMGPMRSPNLPAFATAQAAQQFAAEYGGLVVVESEINASVLNALNDGERHMH